VLSPNVLPMSISGEVTSNPISESDSLQGIAVLGFGDTPVCCDCFRLYRMRPDDPNR